MNLARRMLAAGLLGRKQATPVEPVASDVLIDSCESGWSGATGVLGTNAVAAPALGTGYTVGDLVTVAGGTDGIMQVLATGGGGSVLFAEVVAGGFGYTTGVKATSGGTGSGYTVDVGAVRTCTVAHDGADFVVGSASMRATQSGSLASETTVAARAITPGDLTGLSKLRVRYKNASAITANRWRVCLCSDAAGRVVLDSFWLPATAGTGAWVQAELTRSGGGNISAGVASISLRTRAADWNGQPALDLRLDDIWAIP